MNCSEKTIIALADIGPNANGYMLSQNFSSERFIPSQLGEFRELLSNEE